MPISWSAQRLRQLMRPHMEALCDQVGETINLVVRLGAQTRFLHTVEPAAAGRAEADISC